MDARHMANKYPRVEVEIKIEDYIFVKKKNTLLLPFLCNTLFLSTVTARRRLE